MFAMCLGNSAVRCKSRACGIGKDYSTKEAGFAAGVGPCGGDSVLTSQILTIKGLVVDPGWLRDGARVWPYEPAVGAGRYLYIVTDSSKDEG